MPKLAQRGQSQRASFRPQHQNGARSILLRKLVAVHKVGRGQHPGCVDGRIDNDLQAWMIFRHQRVGRGNHHVFRRKDGGQVCDHIFQLLRRQGGKQHQQAAAGTVGR